MIDSTGASVEKKYVISPEKRCSWATGSQRAWMSEYQRTGSYQTGLLPFAFDITATPCNRGSMAGSVDACGMIFSVGYSIRLTFQM